MRALFAILFLAAISLFANPKDPYALAVTEGEPAALVEGCVSAITGDLYLAEEDALIQGYVPLRLPRQYLSGDGKGTLAGWSFLNHQSAVYKGADNEHQITIQEPNGSAFIFKCSADEVYNHFYKKKHTPKFRPPTANEAIGLTNTAHGDISAHSNLKNAHVRLDEEGRYLTVFCSDQTARRYKIHHSRRHFKDVFKGEESKKIKYLLESETLPSGHKVIYDYDREDRLESIRTTSPGTHKTYASATFHYHHKNSDKVPNVDITLSDGRTLRYRYEEKEKDVFLLRCVTSPEAPEENIFYHGRDKHYGNLISCVSLPDFRFYDIDYYREGHNDVGGGDVKIKDKRDPRFLRVKTLKAPVGTDSTAHITHRFFYSPDQRYTDVREIDNALIRYRYSPSMLLESIERFHETGALNHKEAFEWSENGDIRSRSFYDANGSSLFSRRFQYDDRGNVIREEFCGNLTGKANPSETYTIRREYSNDTRDLLLKEEEQNGKTTLYAYHPNSSLLSAKFICMGSQIKIRTFYEYNGDHVLTKEICDDGNSQDKNDLSCVTTRTIKAITPTPNGPFVDMPHIIEEKYWDGQQETLLKKTVLTYTTGGRVEKQEVYDAAGNYCYTLHNTYDALGHLLTETNALGQTATYSYDKAGNKTTSSTADGRRTATMDYDFCNRLIQMQEVGFDGIAHTTKYAYDGKHNKTHVTDSFGNTTRYVYDAFGHVIQTHLPEIHDENGHGTFTVLRSAYDCAGREISRTDAKNITTTTQYNARSQVTCVQYPDGTKESFFYNLDGTLHTHIDQEGFATTHTYDPFGRRTSTTDPLGNTTKYIYDAFHLIAIKDAEGHITTYTYDKAGRKIAEEKNGERIEYAYDTFNRLRSVKTGDLLKITEYDLLDRIVEERQEDTCGNLLSKVAYAYDTAGNRSCTRSWIMGEEREERMQYDSFDRLILQVDALGHETRISYNERHQNNLGQCVLQTITTDALGQKTIETKDSLGRSASIEIQNPQGETCSLEETYYDRNHNLSRQVSTLFPQRTTIEIRWDYNIRDHLTTLLEPHGKTTRYVYTPKGQLKETLKPDQVVLNRQYDPTGNLIQLSSSDGSISYSFEYNALGQLITSTDLLSHQTTHRTLDPHGRILTEKLANTLTLTKAYDLQGRKTELTLPDASFIAYDYDALHLRKVTRFDSSGTQLYTHRYQEYDLSHHLLSEQLIGNLSNIDYTISPLGQTAAITSSYFTQNVLNYDPVGNITALDTQSQEPIAELNDSGKSMILTHSCRDGSEDILEQVGELPPWQGVAKGRFYASKSFAIGSHISHYTYDDLYQLAQETGPFPHTYAYDSHYNRLQKDEETYTLNALHQLSTIEYDPNGNPRSSNDTRYTYDALDRLIAIETPTQRLTFTYDSFHRRLSKTTYANNEGTWQCTEQLLFLYDGQNEIGATDASGKLIQFRTLGRTPNAEIGAAVAIELQTQIFAPLHDLFGNVVALISLDGHTVESYRYDSFGNHSSATNLPNPWRFVSKRLDESGLIYYGRRYFDPALGRWTTPDPLGLEEGINLYAFVKNNPLIHLDLYGLSIYNPLPVTVPMVTTPMISPKPISTPMVTTPMIDPKPVDPKQIAVNPLPEVHNIALSSPLSFTSRVKATAINTLRNPRVHGSLQAFGGLVEAGFGAGATLLTQGLGAAFGWPIMAHGLDHFFTGINTAFTGRSRDTVTSQMLQRAGLSPQVANMVDSGISIAGITGATAFTRHALIAAFPEFYLPANYVPTNEQILFGQKSVSPFFSKKGTFESRPISEVVQGLKNRTISPESLPIEIIVQNGQKITLNNRSLLALKRAGIEPKTIINRTGIKDYELLLNDHLKGSLPSDVIRIRGGPPGTSFIGSIE